jgi:aldose 1-epimerase
VEPRVTKTDFGKLPDGTAVDLFTLENGAGAIAKITNFGTIITELHVPDRRGLLADVVLGFDSLKSYLAGHPYFGCTVGRVANRIARGRFELDGKTYELAINNGPNSLHGGRIGFDKAVWKAEPGQGASVRFTHRSPDGDENYPGNLDIEVVMTLSPAGELVLDYKATADKATPLNLTNHSYFNLAGAGNVLGHILQLNASHYTPTDGDLIPTGEIKPVAGTPLDFTSPAPIGSRFSQLPGHPSGYDHNFVIEGGGGDTPVLAARVQEPGTGRTMEVLTTEPGVQLYTANFLDGSLAGKGGSPYGQYSAFCLETQHFPDSVNQPRFPSVILRPDQVYRQKTIYKFGTAS